MQIKFLWHSEIRFFPSWTKKEIKKHVDCNLRQTNRPSSIMTPKLLNMNYIMTEQ